MRRRHSQAYAGGRRITPSVASDRPCAARQNRFLLCATTYQGRCLKTPARTSAARAKATNPIQVSSEIRLGLPATVACCAELIVSPFPLNSADHEIRLHATTLPAE